MKVWVAADCEFDLNTEEKIQKWNGMVKKEDDVIIFGNFGDTSVISKLNGRKVFLGEKTFFCYVPAENGNKIVLVSKKEDLVRTRVAAYPIASARSITNQKKIFERNMLSLSFSDWDNTPIEYNELPNIFKNMKNFASIKEDFD